jgi:hypothetical protein
MVKFTPNLRAVAVGCLSCLLFSSCSDSSRSADLQQQLSDLNQQIRDNEKLLANQDKQISKLSTQLDVLQKFLEKQNDKTSQPSQVTVAIEPDKSQIVTPELIRKEIVQYLVGFNARLAAGVQYPAYAQELGALNSTLAQLLLQVDNPVFVTQARDVIKQYNVASDLWSKFIAENTDTLDLTPVERYSYAQSGVTFVDGYKMRLTDIAKFWKVAYEQTQKLIQTEKDIMPVAALSPN